MVTTESRIARRRIGGFDAVCTTIALRAGAIALWQVEDLERHVDRGALLGVGDAPDPPYWALCWSGARVLADAVPPTARDVIELGCGLALPGLAAARHGARVLCVDRLATPLEFVRASAQVNDFRHVAVVAGDLTATPVRRRFDCVLAAEVLYERSAFGAFAAEIARVLAPDGVALLTDAGRIDTRDFYRELGRAGLAWEASTHAVDEEGWPVQVRLVRIVHAHPSA